eukprot:jgi/Bigna1/39934/e_gw1.37.28.1
MISSSQSSSPPQYQSYSRQYVTVGEVIGTESGFLRGHGTRAKEGKLQATVSGFVQRVNKLVSVSALNARYNGEIGDVVICRVLEVGDKRWKCDCNSRQNGVLLLSSVHLPGGVQRRRTEEDQRKMRQYFIEGDLISAEVQKIMNDGAISLHTRNLKYGKLHNGIFLSVPASLIKRCKQHFHHIAEIGLDLILGNNGYIWLQKTRRKQLVGKGFEAKQTEVLPKKKMKQSAHPDAVEGGGGGEGGEEGEDGPGSVSVRDREKMCRIRNSIVALSKVVVVSSRRTSQGTSGR